MCAESDWSAGLAVLRIAAGLASHLAFAFFP
jgi:hypothetical protein